MTATELFGRDAPRPATPIASRPATNPAVAPLDLLPLIRVIHRAIREAAESGSDYRGQTRKAALAVLQLRPDLPAHQVLSLVQQVRHGTPEA